MFRNQPTRKQNNHMNETDTTTVEKSFFIHLRVLRAMANLASKDATRPLLNSVCIHIESSETYYAYATNGRLAGIYQSEDANGFNGPCPAEFIFPLAWLRFFPGTRTIPFKITLGDGGKFTVDDSTSGESISRKFIEGSYPNIWRVLPDSPADPIEGFAFDPRLANHFVKTIKDLGQKEGGIVLRSHNGGKVFSILTHHPNFYGVLMPIRTSLETPAWVQAKIAPQTPKSS